MLVLLNRYSRLPYPGDYLFCPNVGHKETSVQLAVWPENHSKSEGFAAFRTILSARNFFRPLRRGRKQGDHGS